jgi:cephalosporin-C deacetylase-like acetyl esterase
MTIFRFIALALASASPLLAQSDSAYKVPLELKSAGVTLRATLFVARGSGPHPTLVVLKGFPGNASTAFPAYLQSKGFNAIAMNFRGQLDSDGTYDVGGTPDDATALIAYLRSDSAKRAFRIDPQRIAITGTSAGSFGALASAARDPSLRCVALIVPFNWTVTLMTMRDNALLRTAMVNQVEAMTKRANPPVRLDTAFAARTFANAESYDLRAVARRLVGKNVFLIGARYDSTAHLTTHFEPVRDSLRVARAIVRDTILDDNHNLTGTGERVYDLIATWMMGCAR